MRSFGSFFVPMGGIVVGVATGKGSGVRFQRLTSCNFGCGCLTITIRRDDLHV